MLEEFQSELKKLEPLASPILLCKLFIIQHSVLNDITTFCESKKKKKPTMISHFYIYTVVLILTGME